MTVQMTLYDSYMESQAICSLTGIMSSVDNTVDKMVQLTSNLHHVTY